MGSRRRRIIWPLYKLLKQRQALEKIRDLLSPLRCRIGCCWRPWTAGLSQRLLQYRKASPSATSSSTISWKNAPESTTPAGIAPIDTLIGPLLDVFLHEAGHAVFAMLQIPVFGREEDAADQFSTYIMLKFDKDEARRLILGSAYQYKGDLSSPTVTIEQQTFADEHGTSAQRFYNLMCMVYGADPKLFGDVVEKGFLPEERAVICKREYAQLAHAFETLIGPHIDKTLARKLHKRWLPASPPGPPWPGTARSQP